MGQVTREEIDAVVQVKGVQAWLGAAMDLVEACGLVTLVGSGQLSGSTSQSFLPSWASDRSLYPSSLVVPSAWQ